ncbi:hypothetical protein HPB47_008212 [Ixodes persulcatus]|uniref:Uncharacterized protein n=1 Tax=Ixodes persulcatus TaxID=34615 RepID=A0AC60P669_IXOPE|nr:hypothetical protein HPB47_008212 [Ixodes persulcatus]
MAPQAETDEECRLLSPSALVVCFCTDAELTPEPGLYNVFRLVPEWVTTSAGGRSCLTPTKTTLTRGAMLRFLDSQETRERESKKRNIAPQNTDQNSNLSPNIEAIISKIPPTTENDPIIMDAQDSRDGEILDSDAAPADGGEWYPARAPRKRRYMETSSQDSEKDAPRTESLTVIFVPTKEVKAYESLAGRTVEGVIKNVDAALPETKIAGRLRSDTEIARVRRFGSSESVWTTFRGSKLPSHVLLGRVRHPVMEFHHRPTQCYRCGGFGHYAVTCKRSVACSRCAAEYVGVTVRSRGELFSIISVYVPPNVCWDPEELREIEHSRPHVPQTAGGPEESPAASSQNERSRRLDEAQTT